MIKKYLIILLLCMLNINASADAIITNGYLQMGITDYGTLGVFSGNSSSGGSGTQYVGMRYVPNNYEFVGIGSIDEGYSIGDNITQSYGFKTTATFIPSNIYNISLYSFSNTTTSATSIILIPNNITPIIKVTQYYHPSSSNYVYQNDISIQNVGTNNIELIYKKFVDFDVEPKYFEEFVTIRNESNVESMNTALFDYSSPFLPFDTYGGYFVLGNQTDYSKYDPYGDDQGIVFKTNLGIIAPNNYITFTQYYGIFDSKTNALNLINNFNIKNYEMAFPMTDSYVGSNMTLGIPNTVFMGFIVTPTPTPTPTPTQQYICSPNYSGLDFYDIGGYIRVTYNSLSCYVFNLFDFLYSLLYSIFSIPLGILSSLFAGFSLVFGDISGMFTDIINLSSTVYNLVSTILGVLNNNIWITIIMTGFTIVLGLRIYWFIKDIEIAGFKI